jgi:hypothetical protein
MSLRDIRRPSPPQAGGGKRKRAAREEEDGTAMNKRCFPGRLTLEEWLAAPLLDRIDLIWRAQCDLLGSFRYCANKRCRRQRTCGGDAGVCRQRLWSRNKGNPKALAQEWARLDSLKEL